MAVSKAGVLSFILPVFLAGFVTRPSIIEDSAKQLANHVQNANISAEVVSEKINQVVHSSGFKFLLVYGLAAVLTYLAVQLYKAVTEPLALYCDETKYTYLVDGPADGKSAEERVRDLKRCRKVGDVPPVYPNGWMSILMSSELKKKEHKFVAVAGKNLVVFRGESGRPYVVDPYCAHLGANLAIGGSVHGECIECPFHGWSYRGEDGKCVHIGYAEKGGLSLVRPTLPTSAGSHTLPTSMWLYFIGPCFAHFHMDSPLLGELQLVLTVTPAGPMRQRIVTTGYTRRGPISFYIGKKALYEQYYQIWGDLPVWANKKYVRNPPFVKEDHLIAKHRRFFAQFYSENSPKYDPKEESMDW
ncbi:cholesterol 7-desaturase-like [Patiria miniata]|uniref:cholesterol 7-desaturase n=1 Tax=Patiria miniata TaxID=46514 RepID=A0A914A9G1_PATMI|nr:cholesterol 7-desaturase-like [Patiria miniata]